MADVKFAQTFAGPDALRVDLKQSLVGLYGVLGFAFQLVNQSQIHQHGFGFGIELQRFAIALFGSEIELALGPDAPQIVVAKQGIGVEL